MWNVGDRSIPVQKLNQNTVWSDYCVHFCGLEPLPTSDRYLGSSGEELHPTTPHFRADVGQIEGELTMRLRGEQLRRLRAVRSRRNGRSNDVIIERNEGTRLKKVVWI